MNLYGYRLTVIAALLVTTAGAFAADEHDHADKAPATAGAGGAKPENGGHGGHADEVKLTPEAVQRNGIKVERATPQKLAETFVGLGLSHSSVAYPSPRLDFDLDAAFAALPAAGDRA